MTYVSLILSEEAAPGCIKELGKLGCIQFSDLNPELTPFQRRYVSYIRRCDELERKISYIAGEINKLGIPIHDAGTVDQFLERASENDAGTSSAFILEKLEGQLDYAEKKLTELNKFGAKLGEEYTQKVSVVLSLPPHSIYLSPPLHPTPLIFLFTS